MGHLEDEQNTVKDALALHHNLCNVPKSYSCFAHSDQDLGRFAKS